MKNMIKGEKMQVRNLKINYIDCGEGENTLVFLHGWGQNIEMMKPLADNFVKDNRVIIIDLPGHGESTEPIEPLQFPEFVEILREILEKLNVTNPTLIGHSFGGKISLLYASKYETKSLVLFGSPFRKEIKELSLKTKMLKTLKKVPVLNKLEGFAKKHIGSTDYKNASPIMREILVNHVNCDITEDVKNIKCPTLIIWGTNDYTVSINEAYELEKLIPDSAVIAYENCTHYAYLENLGQTINVLDSFIKE